MSSTYIVRRPNETDCESVMLIGTDQAGRCFASNQCSFQTVAQAIGDTRPAPLRLLDRLMQTSSAAHHSADRRMKAVDCSLGDADSAARDRAPDERASTKSGAIDDDPGSRFALV